MLYNFSGLKRSICIWISEGDDYWSLRAFDFLRFRLNASCSRRIKTFWQEGKKYQTWSEEFEIKWKNFAPLCFQHQTFLFFLSNSENLNVMHFSRLADHPQRAVAWSSFRSERLPEFHTQPLNHIFSGLELTSLISWKSAISNNISLSLWSAPRKGWLGVPGRRDSSSQRQRCCLQSESMFAERKHVCSCKYNSCLIGCRKKSICLVESWSLSSVAYLYF